jgi:hypothetical protein
MIAYGPRLSANQMTNVGHGLALLISVGMEKYTGEVKQYQPLVRHGKAGIAHRCYLDLKHVIHVITLAAIIRITSGRELMLKILLMLEIRDEWVQKRMYFVADYLNRSIAIKVIK